MLNLGECCSEPAEPALNLNADPDPDWVNECGSGSRIKFKFQIQKFISPAGTQVIHRY
jgi:hypothetical protein